MPPPIVSLGERVSALEVTVAIGSKNLCEKFQEVRKDIATLDERLDRIEYNITKKAGVDNVMSWFLDIAKVLIGGVMLWAIQHWSLSGGGNH